MTKSKRGSIEVYPIPDEKELIQAKAHERGLSASRFLIEAAIAGRDVGARRRMEGALSNAALHWRLGQVLRALQAHAGFSEGEKQALGDLIQELRREVARVRGEG